MTMSNYILTIAGSDVLSGGGLQADLATFAAHDLVGFLALTSIATVADSGEFTVTPCDAQLLTKQLHSLKDVPFAAIKLGLLPNQELATLVQEFIAKHPDSPVVLDPVLVFKENQDQKLSQMRQLMIDLFPYASVITPNLREAEILSGQTITTLDEMKAAAKTLHQLGAKTVVIKGGSRLNKHDAIDVFFDGKDMAELKTDLLYRNNNGAGCTFAAAIASNLAKGLTPQEAVIAAKQFVYQAIAHSTDYGVYPHETNKH